MYIVDVDIVSIRSDIYAWIFEINTGQGKGGWDGERAVLYVVCPLLNQDLNEPIDQILIIRTKNLNNFVRVCIIPKLNYVT